nr:hypothetical protein Iba_chr05eCG9510 [Ipomoea batatas]
MPTLIPSDIFLKSPSGDPFMKPLALFESFQPEELKHEIWFTLCQMQLHVQPPPQANHAHAQLCRNSSFLPYSFIALGNYFAQIYSSSLPLFISVFIFTNYHMYDSYSLVLVAAVELSPVNCDGLAT